MHTLICQLCIQHVFGLKKSFLWQKQGLSIYANIIGGKTVTKQVQCSYDYCSNKMFVVPFPSFHVLEYWFPDNSEGQELLPLSPRSKGLVMDSPRHLLPPGEKPKTSAHYRALWKTAIHQQILLLRMEKENQRLEGESNMPNNLKFFGHIHDKCILAFAFFVRGGSC